MTKLGSCDDNRVTSITGVPAPFTDENCKNQVKALPYWPKHKTVLIVVLPEIVVLEKKDITQYKIYPLGTMNSTADFMEKWR